jgi:putative transposase
MIALPQRQEMIADIEQARQAGARLKWACVELGLSARTFARWQRDGTVCADGRPAAIRPAPSHKLTKDEREQILAVCHEPRFADLPPAQIVPRLADEGVYIASESTYYRVLRVRPRAASSRSGKGAAGKRASTPYGPRPQRGVELGRDVFAQPSARHVFLPIRRH